MKKIKLIVSGRVQGIGFRAEVKRFADACGLRGHVMNRDDGSVEIVAHGAKRPLESLIGFVKSSPGLSKVENVAESRISPLSRNFFDFQIVREKSFLKDQENALRNLRKRILRD